MDNKQKITQLLNELFALPIIEVMTTFQEFAKELGLDLNQVTGTQNNNTQSNVNEEKEEVVKTLYITKYSENIRNKVNLLKLISEVKEIDLMSAKSLLNQLPVELKTGLNNDEIKQLKEQFKLIEGIEFEIK